MLIGRNNAKSHATLSTAYTRYFSSFHLSAKPSHLGKPMKPSTRESSGPFKLFLSGLCLARLKYEKLVLAKQIGKVPKEKSRKKTN